MLITRTASRVISTGRFSGAARSYTGPHTTTTTTASLYGCSYGISTYRAVRPPPHRTACAAMAFSTHTVEPHRGKPPRISRPFQDSNNSSRAAIVAGGGLLAAACLATAYSALKSRQPSCERVAPPPAETRDGYPIISKAEVAKHKSAEAGGAWVTYAGGVYDITDFIANHPGGAARISMAAGGALEPFWKLYAIHMKDEVLDILKEMRIGSISLEEMVEGDKSSKDGDSDNPYAKEPARLPVFIVNSSRPFNAEPPPELLLDAGFITPNELYYVRNHLPVPLIDPKKYRLQVEVEGKAGRCVQYSLADLKNMFPNVKVVTAIQCAGNRRSDITKVRPVKGLGWSCSAVSNSEWTGVRLRDVLKHAGVDVNDPESAGIEHVQFEGLDRDLTTCYGASIPVSKAVDPNGDVLLAFEMNGEPIPRDHGFPLRVVVPGVVGARNVKWLGKVVASKHESDNHWQQKDYKGFNSSTDWDTADFSKAPAIQQLPINSAILTPTDGSMISSYDDEVTVKGYALAGGGRAVVRVDVSADGGESWTVAELQPTSQPMNRTWAWTLWKATLPIPKDKSEVEIVCKAIDEGYNCQPERSEPIWNIRGVLSNSWHRVALKVEDEE